MRTDSQIKQLGIEALNKHLGRVDAEKFVALIQREKFNYTDWRQDLFEGLSGREISQKAMEYQQTLKGR